MSPDQRALLILVSAPIIIGWILTELTHSWGWGVKK
jgi:hypothetical protein